MPHPGDRWRDDDEQLVPLFALTRGRAYPSISQLNLGSLVKANPSVLTDTSGLEREQQHILRICRSWLSVAEVAVEIRVPLAVAKVQISDLVTRRAMRVSTPAASMAAGPDRRMLETLLEGLRAM